MLADHLGVALYWLRNHVLPRYDPGVSESFSSRARALRAFLRSKVHHQLIALVRIDGPMDEILQGFDQVPQLSARKYRPLDQVDSYLADRNDDLIKVRYVASGPLEIAGKELENYLDVHFRDLGVEYETLSVTKLPSVPSSLPNQWSAVDSRASQPDPSPVYGGRTWIVTRTNDEELQEDRREELAQFGWINKNDHLH